MNDDISAYDSHRAVKRDFHQDAVLQKELDRALEEYRSLNLKHYSAPEMNDMRRHFTAIDAVPDLIRMIQEEIEIIKRHGPRPSPFWDMVG